MGRPPKDPEDRKSYHLRVPLTDAQRSLIEEASKLAGEDLAGWARAVLLRTATKEVRKSGKHGGKPPY